VSRWEGCYAGIMGLPLKLAADLLMESGIAVPARVAAVCEQLSSSNCCTRGKQSLVAQDC
jgi:hypothetical protein